MTASVARGRFSVTMAPAEGVDPRIGSLSLDKSYEGDLVANSVGHMLAIRSAVEGSAGYVAMEQVTGALHGQQGGFALQHIGLMDRGEPSLTVVIVPDSGTGALEGIKGQLEIEIADGVHSYRLDYTLSG